MTSWDSPAFLFGTAELPHRRALEKSFGPLGSLHSVPEQEAEERGEGNKGFRLVGTGGKHDKYLNSCL